MRDKRPAEKSQPDRSPFLLDGLRLLVVENDSDTLQMLKFVLEQNGADVIATDNVADALKEFEAKKPEAVLADIAMPDLNGYALIAEIRRMDAERGGETKAIAVTAFSTQRDRELALASGFQAYVTKPFDPHALVQTIADLVR